MRFFDIFGGQRQTKQDIKLELEKDFLQEKHDLKLEFERRRREIELETREKRAELERLKLDFEIKAQKQMIEDEFSDFEEDDSEGDETNALLTQFVGGIMAKHTPQTAKSLENSPSPPTSSNYFAAPEKPAITDDDIRDMIDTIPPKYLKLAKKMDDATIKIFIRGKYPTLDDATIERAINIFRGKP